MRSIRIREIRMLVVIVALALGWAIVRSDLSRRTWNAEAQDRGLRNALATAEAQVGGLRNALVTAQEMRMHAEWDRSALADRLEELEEAESRRFAYRTGFVAGWDSRAEAEAETEVRLVDSREPPLDSIRTRSIPSPDARASTTAGIASGGPIDVAITRGEQRRGGGGVLCGPSSSGR